ncbi:MAG: alkaline phosphatase [Rubrobacteraceae bacterium]|jgi:membrane protein DedA with SNARE-associated domain|nr:alkaline phosphatase [Rubrobacteraceae bacterium]
MGGVLTDLVRWVIEVVHSLEYVGVFVLILAGSLYLPVPTELTLPLFGFLIGNGRLSFVPVLLAATAARVCAALVLYSVGYRLKEARLRRVIEPFERSKLLFVSDFDTASAVFERHGGKAILVGHLIPGVGALVSVPAGLKRMPVRGRFLGYTILGCSIWNASLIGLGWALGGRWRIVEVFTSFVGAAVLIVLISATVWFFWRRRKVHE